MLLTSNKAKIGSLAPTFKLLNINNRHLSLYDIKNNNGIIIAFICNHCPYVKDLIKRLVKDFSYLQSINYGTVAIMPNDTQSYPEDSFDKMKEFSKDHNFSFPYLYDEKQNVSKQYNAVCTPDFFAYDNNNKLFYRGRLDNLKYKSKTNSREKSLIDACIKMKVENKIIQNQINSIGCSIKWKN